MKNPFKKLAAVCVTAYANRTYRKAAELAEAISRNTRTRQYVISDPFPQNASRLIVVSAKGLQRMRQYLKDLAGVFPKDTLITQSWYYTAGRSGKDRISSDEMEVRRLAFVRMMLERARLTNL